MPEDDMLRFPAAGFLSFFDNHGLLGRNRHRWRTVTGGSAVYVDRMAEPLRGRLRLGCAVARLRRTGPQVTVIDETGQEDRFDQVILACHSDTALSLLEGPDDEERRVLGALGYLSNEIYLHGDPSLMPRRRRAWSSWNVLVPDPSSTEPSNGSRFGVTYWMNRLQRIADAPPLFVSVNPARPPRGELVFDHLKMDHPRVDWRALAGRRTLHTIQGRRGIWFCGAYTGSGFHEDGLLSGERVAEALLARKDLTGGLEDLHHRAAG